MKHIKNILITGVSSGFGTVLARDLTRKMVRVFGTVRNQNDAQRLRQQLGSTFFPLICDVTDTGALLKTKEQVEEVLAEEKLDVLINNAGIAVGGPVLALSSEKIKQQFEVNVFAVLEVSRVFLPLMLNAPPNNAYCKIINISSVSGQIVFPYLGAYAASKHALEALSHAMRRELCNTGVKVVIIGPGPVKTAIWDKAKEQKLAHNFKDTIWAKPLQKLEPNILNSEKNAMELDLFSKRMQKIIFSKHPKHRYSIVKNRFSDWLVPRYLLPSKILDFIIAKISK